MGSRLAIIILCMLGLHNQTTAQPDLLHNWSKAISNIQLGNNDIFPKAIEVDAAGNTYITGEIKGVVDFNPGAALAFLGINGKQSIFIAKYDNTGAYIFAKVINGSSNWMLSNSLALDAAGSIYIAGGFAGGADFDPGPGERILNCAGGLEDIFFARFSTTGDLIFAHQMGNVNDDIARGIAVDGIGNVWITGHYQGTVDFDPGGSTYNLTSTFNGTYYTSDIFLAKYNNAAGGWILSNTMGGTTNSESAGQIALDASGNVYIAGKFQGTSDLDPSGNVANIVSAGNDDIFLAKYTILGNYVYAKSFGGTYNDVISGLAVNGGNAWITGDFKGTVDFDPGVGISNLISQGPNSNSYIARYDPNGDYVFAKSIQGAASSTDIIVDGTNNAVITGFLHDGDNDFDPSGNTANVVNGPYWYDTFIARYDGNGNFFFVKHFGNIYFSPQSSIEASMIAYDPANNLIVARNFEGLVDPDPGPSTTILSVQQGFSNCYISKYSSTGLYLFANQIGGRNTDFLNDEGKAITKDAAGNIYVAGTFSGSINSSASRAYPSNLTSVGFTDIFVVKYSASGNFLYSFSVGSAYDDFVYGIAVDAGNNVIITGSFAGVADFDPGAGTANLTSAGGYDIFIAKYNSTGAFVFANRFGGASPDAGQAVVTDAAGNIYVTGYYKNTVDFDPGGATANLVSANNSQDIFFAKYNSSGNYVYAKSIGGWDYDQGNAIGVDGTGNVWIAGHFDGYTTGGADFDPGAGTAYLFSFGDLDMFIAKYDVNGNYLFAKKFGGTNPVESVRGLVLGATGNAYVTGDISGTAYFGFTTLVSAPCRTNTFIANYDPSGNGVFAKCFGGDADVHGTGISLNCGGIYITGYFDLTADFDPGSDTAYLASISSSNDIFLAKYDLEGDYINAIGMGGSYHDIPYAITTGISNDIFITGSFEYLFDFDPASGSNYLVADNKADIFIARFTESNTKFKSFIAGQWSNPATWGSCQIPNQTTPVIIGSDVEVAANASCKTMDVLPQGKITVKPAVELKVFQ